MIFETLASLSIVIGTIFIFVGSFGMVKLPNLMTRLHAPTKATTLGMGGTLIGSMIYFLNDSGHFSMHEVLVTLFLFLTAPVTAHFIAKAYLFLEKKEKAELPKTTHECGWSTYDSLKD